MTSRPLLHPETSRHIDRLLKLRRGSYAFVGPKAIGKYTTARWLAEQIALPADIVIVAPTEKPSLGIAAARDLRQTLSLGRASESDRVVIIDDADLLTDQAQNALLKTLEEPPDGTAIILITSNFDRLLTTIRSRLVPVRFGPVKDGEIVKIAQSVMQSTADIEAMVPAAEGRPGVVLGLLADPERLERWNQAQQIAGSVMSAKPFEGLRVAAQLAEDKELSVDFVLLLGHQLRQDLRAHPESALHLERSLEALERLIRYQNAHVAPRAALESLILELAC